jgi:hypothetical protein
MIFMSISNDFFTWIISMISPKIDRYIDVDIYLKKNSENRKNDSKIPSTTPTSLPGPNVLLGCLLATRLGFWKSYPIGQPAHGSMAQRCVALVSCSNFPWLGYIACFILKKKTIDGWCARAIRASRAADGGPSIASWSRHVTDNVITPDHTESGGFRRVVLRIPTPDQNFLICNMPANFHHVTLLISNFFLDSVTR